MTKPVDNHYPLVICKWLDIISSDSNWRSADEAIDWVDTESGVVIQTGFMLEKNDEYLILLCSFFLSGDTVGTITRIPIDAVKAIKVIDYVDLFPELSVDD